MIISLKCTIYLTFETFSNKNEEEIIDCTYGYDSMLKINLNLHQMPERTKTLIYIQLPQKAEQYFYTDINLILNNMF